MRILLLITPLLAVAQQASALEAVRARRTGPQGSRTQNGTAGLLPGRLPSLRLGLRPVGTMTSLPGAAAAGPQSQRGQDPAAAAEFDTLYLTIPIADFDATMAQPPAPPAASPRTGIETVDRTAEALAGAHAAETAGDPQAHDKAGRSVFDGVVFPLSAAAGLVRKDATAVSFESLTPAEQEIAGELTLAGVSEGLAAPAHYKQALSLAAKKLPQEKALKKIALIQAMASQRAVRSFQQAAEDVLALAASGKLGQYDGEQIVSALQFWKKQLAAGHQSHQADISILLKKAAAVALAAKAAAPAALKAPSVQWKPHRADGLTTYVLTVVPAPKPDDSTPLKKREVEQEAPLQAGAARVHKSRGVFHRAIRYNLVAPLPDFETQANPDFDETVRVDRRDSDPKGLEDLRNRFKRFNVLIEDNFSALEILAQNAGKVTVKTARTVLERVRAMAAGLQALRESDKRSKNLSLGLEKIAQRLEPHLSGLGENDPLSPKALELVTPIDTPALHYYVNQIHQAALEGLSQANSSSAENALLVLQRGPYRKEVELYEISEEPPVKDGRLVGPALRALVRALRESHDTPEGFLVAQDQTFSGHFKLGSHSAEVSAVFLPADEGGMMRVRYQEWGTGIYNLTRLYYIGRILEELGFAVKTEGNFLTAEIDKDHISQTVDQLSDTFSLVIQALHGTVGLDNALPKLIEGEEMTDENKGRIDEWVQILLAEGSLPFYVRDDDHKMLAGFSRHQASGSIREKHLRRSLNEALKRLGLPAFPDGTAVGQRTIDLHFNKPIEEALARGELARREDGRLARAKGDPLEALARDLYESPGAMARAAEAVGSLDPTLFSFEPLGAIGALHAERAVRPLDSGSWLILHVLRDPANGQAVFAKAELGTLTGKPSRLSPEAMLELLAASGLPVATFSPAGADVGAAIYHRKARAWPQSVPEGAVFSGLAASAGSGETLLAPVTFDKAKAAGGGYVFAAPFTSPDDLDAIRGAKAVLTTSGGQLSHAAITTREMGKPSLILPQATWSQGELALREDILGPVRSAAGYPLRQVKLSRWVHVGEGSLVRLDPVAGALRLYPPEAQKPLLELARALEIFDRTNDAGAMAAWAVTALKSADRTEKSLGRRLLYQEMLTELVRRQSAGRALWAGALAGIRAEARSGVVSPDSDLDAVEAALFSAQREAALSSLDEIRHQLSAAGSPEAIERLSTQALKTVTRLRAMGEALGRPASDSAALDGAASELMARGKSRLEEVFRVDVAELESAALNHPHVTPEILPRLKGLVAKAERRRISPELVRGWREDIRRLEESRLAERRAQRLRIIPLYELLDVDVPFVGGKAAKLGAIADVVRRAGGLTADGLSLTIDAYRGFLKETGIERQIEDISRLDLPIEEKSARIRRLILGAPLERTKGIGQEILLAVHKEGLADYSFAVRSSAVDEDGAEAAFAGAGDTKLFVRAEELLSSVKEVWASLWNPRALLYRQERGLSVTGLNQAVVVQVMVNSEVSGVAFTQDPVSGHPGRMIVNASWGLGEAIVSGRVAPDQYVLGRAGREVLPAMISDKKVQVVRRSDARGVEERRVPARQRRLRSLSPARLKVLHDVSRALESHFGYALDIEFAFTGDRLYILQARAVTTAGPAAAKSKAAEPARRKILFVCTGNTCRSPMAEAIARDLASREGGRGLSFESRGLAAETGAGMTEPARIALSELGIEAGGHRAGGLSAEDVRSADVLLAMTLQQRDAVLARFPEANGKIHLVSEYAGLGTAEVGDPYGGGLEVYRRTAEQLRDALSRALQRFLGGH